MTVMAADGRDVESFETDRLLVSVAESYDVLITLPPEGAFEFRATAQDGSDHVAAFLGKGTRVAAPDVPKPDYYQNAMNVGYLRAMWRTAWDVGGDVALLPPGETRPVTESQEQKAMAMGAMREGDSAVGRAMTGRPGTP